MSIFTTIAKDGISAGLKLIPTPYLLGVAAAAAIGLFIWAKVWFHNKVEAEAQKEINAYIANEKKDDAELSEVVASNNTKIQIQYVHDKQIVVKRVLVNHTVITTKVPDVNTILSDGWVSAFNSSVAGKAIDPVSASVSTPSGVSATQALDTINDNNGVCQTNLIQLTALQKWVNDTKAEVAAQNKKDGVK